MLSVLRPSRIAATTQLIASAMGAPTYGAAIGYASGETRPHSNAVRVTATLATGRIERLQRCLRDAGAGDAVAVRQAGMPQRAEDDVRAAIAFLEVVEPETCAQIEMLIGTIEVVEVEGCESGSSPDDPGRFWVSVAGHRDPVTLGASVRHEIVHQALFAEEMLGTLFLPEVDDAPSVVSAVRGVERPFRSAFHAAAVSAALIRYYHAVDRSALADTLRRTLRPSVAQLAEHRGVLGPHGLELLDEIQCIANSSSGRCQLVGAPA